MHLILIKIKRKYKKEEMNEKREVNRKIKKKINRIMIAAPKSGSGKTTVTLALLLALKKMGQDIRSYKCGPDYIDPMFHEKVIKVPAKNLDTFFTNKEQTKQLFLADALEHGFSVLEGVMGLFDGLGGIREEGSSYHLAKITKTPIILVVDAKGMGRSMIALLAGFLAYDKEHLIQGVILNRISKSYYKIIKPYIELELHLLVLGFLPEKEIFHIESRYLGLIMPEEVQAMEERIQIITEEFIKTVSIKGLIKIAEQAEVIEAIEDIKEIESIPYKYCNFNKKIEKKEKPVIAVARDEAFCFYYADNIRILEEQGAEIVYFSPLYDKKLPNPCHALLIGGGYPELYAKKLSENIIMHREIKQAIEQKLPIVAECGGFMYLHSAIIDKNNIRYDMVNVIPGICFYTGKLVRFGYIEIEEKRSYFLPENNRIKGHEFHYYDSTCQGEDALAIKPATGKTYSCIIESESYWMGFPHLYYPSNESFVTIFIEKAKKYKNRK